MDDLDREILNEIQWTFPLVQRPYDTRYTVDRGSLPKGRASSGGWCRSRRAQKNKFTFDARV